MWIEGVWVYLLLEEDVITVGVEVQEWLLDIILCKRIFFKLIKNKRKLFFTEIFFLDIKVNICFGDVIFFYIPTLTPDYGH